MNDITLAIASLKARTANTTLSILLVAFGVMLATLVILFGHHIERRLGADGQDGPDGAERDVALLRRGIVTGVPFRRGAASALVEIDGLGTVTVHEAATGARALESLDVGDVVQLRLTLGSCAPCA